MNSLHDSLGPTFIHNLLVLSECSGLIMRFCRLSACTVLPQRHDVKTMSSIVYNNLVLPGLVLTPVSRLIYRRVHRCQQAGLDPTNANEIVFYNVKGERSFFFDIRSLSLSIQSIISPNNVLLRKKSRITTARPASAAVVRLSPAVAFRPHSSGSRNPSTSISGSASAWS